VLILDEAHEAAEIARDFFGFTLTEYGLKHITAFVKKHGMEGTAVRMEAAASELFGSLKALYRSSGYDVRLRRAGFANADTLLECLKDAGDLAASRIENDLDLDIPQDSKAAKRAKKVLRAAANARRHLQEVLALKDKNKVYWLEEVGKRKSMAIKAKLINVADSLRREMFGGTDTVVMTSATLATGGNFDFIRGETGLPPNCLEHIAETPFNFQTQSAMLIPAGLPLPNDPAFPDHVAGAIHHLSAMAGGRTMALFTSYRNMTAVRERLAKHSDFKLLVQRDAPRSKLIEQFKAVKGVGVILLGVASFWTGIDIQGTALTCLVIDKLPFPNPKDPFVDGLQAKDTRSFFTYSVPRAIITLKQGSGRLIRSATDYGVLTILDKRLVEKSYGRGFLASLPPYPTTRDIPTVERFLKEHQA